MREKKSITLMGMSGAGKSYLSDRLSMWGYDVFSCDEHIAQSLKARGFIDDTSMSALSNFVGKIGNPEQGGLSLNEFRKRQTLYYEAECEALRAFSENECAINDSTGSLCEIEDEALLARLGQHSLIVYLKVDKSAHDEVLARAISHPKPLYFPPLFFDKHLAKYMSETKNSDISDINPDAFLKWIFPHLFRARLPKYQVLADAYGVTISAQEITNVKNRDAFKELIEKAENEQTC